MSCLFDQAGGPQFQHLHFPVVHHACPVRGSVERLSTFDCPKDQFSSRVTSAASVHRSVLSLSNNITSQCSPVPWGSKFHASPTIGGLPLLCRCQPLLSFSTKLVLRREDWSMLIAKAERQKQTSLVSRQECCFSTEHESS